MRIHLLIAFVLSLGAAFGAETPNADGGTNQQGRTAANVVVTGFSEYDRAFISAVQAKWSALLDKYQGKIKAGRVVLEFRLHADGRVTNLKTATNEVGKALGRYCEKAILEPAPYLPWPDEMRRAYGADHRDAKFTFFYK